MDAFLVGFPTQSNPHNTLIPASKLTLKEKEIFFSRFAGTPTKCRPQKFQEKSGQILKI